jgi:hypothetical protein
MSKRYVVRNDAIGVYFAGVVPLHLGDGVVISPMIFAAVELDTKAEAQRVASQLPGDWTVSEVSSAMSKNLVGAVSLGARA